MSTFASVVNTFTPSGTPTTPQAKKFAITFTPTQLSVKLVVGASNTGNTLAPQSAIVDNSTNSNTVILTVSGTNYSVPAGATYTIPLASVEDPDVSIVSAGSGTTYVTLSNVKMSAFAPAAPVSLQPVGLNPISSSLTDYSGTITTASSSQQVCPAVTQRNYFLLQNNSADSLWFNFTQTATLSEPSIELAPGDSFIMENTFVSNESISIIGATAGQSFTCKVQYS